VATGWIEMQVTEGRLASFNTHADTTCGIGNHYQLTILAGCGSRLTGWGKCAIWYPVPTTDTLSGVWPCHRNESAWVVVDASRSMIRMLMPLPVASGRRLMG